MPSGPPIPQSWLDESAERMRRAEQLRKKEVARHGGKEGEEAVKALVEVQKKRDKGKEDSCLGGFWRNFIRRWRNMWQFTWG